MSSMTQQWSIPKTRQSWSLFEEQVQRHRKMRWFLKKSNSTYQQLNERSNQLAHYLRSKGVRKETLVPICIESGLEMIVGS